MQEPRRVAHHLELHLAEARKPERVQRILVEVEVAGIGEDLVDVLARRVTETMTRVMLNTRVVEMKAEAKGIRVSFEGEGAKDSDRSQLFDRVLVSVGRRPNSKIPGLDSTRVRVNERGFIVVDEQLRTDEPSIFAIGDVVGEPMLAHKASHEGRRRGSDRRRKRRVRAERHPRGRVHGS
jgi:dihydrolipoamide dehydrogenase